MIGAASHELGLAQRILRLNIDGKGVRMLWHEIAAARSHLQSKELQHHVHAMSCEGCTCQYVWAYAP